MQIFHSVWISLKIFHFSPSFPPFCNSRLFNKVRSKTLPISQGTSRNVDGQMRCPLGIHSKDQGLSSVIEASRDRPLVHREWGGFIEAQVTHQLSRIDVDGALMPATRAQRPSRIDDTPVAGSRNTVVGPPFLPITFYRRCHQQQSGDGGQPEK